MRGKTRTEKQREQIFRSLTPYLKLGYSLNKACVLAKIPTSTGYDLIKNNEELRIKMESFQNLVSQQARKIICDQITKEKDPRLAQWWLERQEKEDFSTRTENRNQNEHSTYSSHFDMDKLRLEIAERIASKKQGNLNPIVYPNPSP